jgi:hypothetical protein
MVNVARVIMYEKIRAVRWQGRCIKKGLLRRFEPIPVTRAAVAQVSFRGQSHETRSAISGFKTRLPSSNYGLRSSAALLLPSM